MAKTFSFKAGQDRTLPDVTFEIGGKVRRLAYDFAAICTAEKLTGINLFKAAHFDNLSFSEVRGLLYAALLHDDPSLTLEQFDRECGPQMIRNMFLCQEVVARAWIGSIPDEEENADSTGEAQAQATA